MDLAWVRIAPLLAAALSLSGCGDLTRSDAERILNTEARGSACQASLDFVQGGIEKAKTNGVIPENGRGLGSAIKLAATSDGDQWKISCFAFVGCNVSRISKPNVCLPGKVAIRALADAPAMLCGGNCKQVDFIEIVTLPPELQSLAPYVNTRYEKKLVLQKADSGWRVAR